MAQLVRHRGGRNAAIAAGAGALIARYGRHLGHAALAGLQDALYEGAAQGAEELNRQLTNWIQEHGNQLGNRAVTIARNIREGARETFQELWNAGQDTLANFQRETEDTLATFENRELANPEDADLPDLDELMPEQGGENVEMQVARAGGPGGPSGVSKETPISRYPSLTYGLQETHTTILPWKGWFSITAPNHDQGIKAQFRLNAIWDMFMTTLNDVTDGTTVTTKGIYNKPLGPTGVHVSGNTFPMTIASGANATERPQWRDYWAQLYDYYTVLGCEYKIIVQNSGNSRSGDLLVGVEHDSYSDTATSTGNVMPDAYLYEVLNYKNIEWHTAWANTAEEDHQSNMCVIEGRYKPGSIKRNIVNDGDVKTWTATTSTLPNLKDILTINFWKHPLSYSAATSIQANIQVELKYIVQFKDLKVQARYPTLTITDQDIKQEISDATNTTRS